MEAHLNKAEFSLYFNSLVWVIFQEDRIQMISWEKFSQNASKASSRTTRVVKHLNCSFSNHISSCKTVDLIVFVFCTFLLSFMIPKSAVFLLDPPPPSGFSPMKSSLKKPLKVDVVFSDIFFANDIMALAFSQAISLLTTESSLGKFRKECKLMKQTMNLIKVCSKGGSLAMVFTPRACAS